MHSKTSNTSVSTESSNTVDFKICLWFKGNPYITVLTNIIRLNNLQNMLNRFKITALLIIITKRYMPKKLEQSVTKFIAILEPEFSDLIKMIFNVLSYVCFFNQ